MKVLHIIDHLGFGGAQRIVEHIFDNNHTSPILFLFSLRNQEDSEKITHSNLVISSKHSRFSIQPINELKQLIAEANIDIIHCHLFRSLFYGWLLKLFWFPKIKLIYHEHGQIMGSEKNILIERYLYRLFLRLSGNKCDAVIAVSKRTKNMIERYGKIKGSKVKVVTNPIVAPRWQNIDKSTKESVKLTKNDFIVGFAGRIIERKGWRELIKAAILVNHLDPTIKFLLAGSGPEQHMLLKQIRLYHLENSVYFLGYTKNMLDFYQSLDCIIVPSKWEPCSITIREAQALKLPIIASNISSNNELIINNHTGLLYSLGDTSTLVDSIIRIKKDPSAAKSFAENAYADIHQNNSDSYIRKLQKIYRAL